MTNQEIDRLVAEKVMGWWLEDSTDISGNEIAIWRNDKGNRMIYGGPWQPTSDIAQAFQVAIRMKELGWQVDLDMYPDEKPGCSLWKTGSQTDAYAEGDSMPLAICVASLRVLGVEVAE